MIRFVSRRRHCRISEPGKKTDFIFKFLKGGVKKGNSANLEKSKTGIYSGVWVGGL